MTFLTKLQNVNTWSIGFALRVYLHYAWISESPCDNVFITTLVAVKATNAIEYNCLTARDYLESFALVVPA